MTDKEPWISKEKINAAQILEKANLNFERALFDSRLKGLNPEIQCKIGLSRFTNALVTPPFGWKNQIWEIKITFHKPLVQNEKMIKFFKMIERCYQIAFLEKEKTNRR